MIPTYYTIFVIDTIPTVLNLQSSKIYHQHILCGRYIWVEVKIWVLALDYYTLRKKGSTQNYFVLSGEPCHLLGFYQFEEPDKVLYSTKIGSVLRFATLFGSLENLFQFFVEPLRVLLRGQL